MKMNYKNQLILTVVIILLANVLNTVFHHWLFSSAGRVLCGLIWLLHPVMIGPGTPTRRDLNIIRLSGVFLADFTYTEKRTSGNQAAGSFC